MKKAKEFKMIEEIEEKRQKETYQLSDELFEVIRPIIERLNGAEILLKQLAANMGKDKHFLWEIIYNNYPELRGKDVVIDEQKKRINLLPKKKGSLNG